MNILSPVWVLLLCGVGLLLSLEYKGERYRIVLAVFRVLSLLLAIASAVGWLMVAFPSGVVLALGLAAIGVNLPLAAIGLKKK